MLPLRTEARVEGVKGCREKYIKVVGRGHLGVSQEKPGSHFARLIGICISFGLNSQNLPFPQSVALHPLLGSMNCWHSASPQFLSPCPPFPAPLPHGHTVLLSAPGFGISDSAGHKPTEHVPSGQHHCEHRSPTHLPTPWWLFPGGHTCRRLSSPPSPRPVQH